MKPINLRSHFFTTIQAERIYCIKLLWILCFLFHTILDPAITYVAVVMLEVGIESNPFIQRWLDKGIGMFVLIHIPVYIFGIIGFMILQWLFNQGSKQEQRQVYYLSIIVLGGVNIWGVVLVLNNLWVIWITS